MDGYGWLLRDQTTRLPHVNRFLRKVPEYQVRMTLITGDALNLIFFQEKIDTIHEHVIRGDNKALEKFFEDDKSGNTWSSARDHYGHSPLHKAVMANQEDTLRFVMDKYPHHIEDRDNVNAI